MSLYIGRNPLQQIGKNKDDIETLQATHFVEGGFNMTAVIKYKEASLAALQAHPATDEPLGTFGMAGDVLYVVAKVGDATPTWKELGVFPAVGPQGPKGDIGATGPQGPAGKDGRGLENVTGFSFMNANVVSYNTTTGATFIGKARFSDKDGVISAPTGTVILPIKGGNGVVVDAAAGNKSLEVRVGDTITLQDEQTITVKNTDDIPLLTIGANYIDFDPDSDYSPYFKLRGNSANDESKEHITCEYSLGDKGDGYISWIRTNLRYTIDGVPTSATSGTLPNDDGWEYVRLANSNGCDIIFNKERYRLNDDQHTTGTLVFSHLGYEASWLVIKTITITLATRGWVLTTITPATHIAAGFNDLTSDSAGNNVIGTMFYSIPSPNSTSNADSIIAAIGADTYFSCTGYITYKGETEPIIAVDSYDPNTHTIVVYTPKYDINAGGISCFTKPISPDMFPITI